VAARAPDEVVVATGARWGRPKLPGVERPNVRTVPELRAWLDGGDDAHVGDAVAILGGGKTGLSLADLCLRRGRSVTLIEATNVFGVELGLPGRFRLVHDLEAKGARLVGDAVVESIDDDGLSVRMGEQDEHIAADTVLIAEGAIPDDSLHAELDRLGITTHVVGDCGTIGRIEGANLDAARVALAIA
jgi:2,4-dienoyl-CoA reductase (NADPH2)